MWTTENSKFGKTPFYFGTRCCTLAFRIRYIYIYMYSLYRMYKSSHPMTNE